MKSRVFVGSSSESLDVAYAVQQNLEADVDVTVWTQGVFALSQTTMDGLIRQGSEVDFAVFVLSPDDVTKLRGREHPTARDNVIFEIGIFVGRLGMSRTFLLVAEGSEPLHLPSDLLGITCGKYNATRQDGNTNAAVGSGCTQIRQAIKQLGSRLN